MVLKERVGVKYVHTWFLGYHYMLLHEHWAHMIFRQNLVPKNLGKERQDPLFALYEDDVKVFQK